MDSGFRRYRFRLSDNTADNSSAARVVLGTPVPLDDLDLANVRVRLEVNGELIETATGDAALGHPARAVAWLNDQLHDTDRALRSGHILISGGLTRALPLGDGDRVVARSERLGSVSLQASGTAASAGE